LEVLARPRVATGRRDSQIDGMSPILVPLLIALQVLAAGGEERAHRGRAALPGGGPAARETGRRADEPMRVAVVELAVADASHGGDSRALRDWMVAEGIEPTALLREALGRPETYGRTEEAGVTAVEEGRIDDALSAEGIDARRCTAASCAARIGTRLGADRVVTGEVTKLSVLIWFVTARVVDVPTGRVLRSEELEVKGVITDLLPKVMVSLARRLTA
jgi:hypothetical protein